MKKTDRYADENARPFDPQWETVLPSLRDYLIGLADSLQEHEIASQSVGRSRRRKGAVLQKYRDAVQAIGLDLFRARLSDPRLEVGIGVGRPAVQKMCSDQYGAKFLSARTFEDALRTMRSLNLIIITTEHWDDPRKQESRVRRYQASPDLLAALRGAGASVVALRRRNDAENIILRGKKNTKTGKKPLVSYGVVAFANDARDRLKVINNMLDSHWADLALTDQQLAEETAMIAGKRDDEVTQSFDFAARTLYRVFNNSDWEQGGRFYGGWWMACPSKLRRYILLDGKRTVEVDYAGLHAAMLYAQTGLNIPDDPYEKCLSGSGNKAERNLVKRTFNALLNAGSVAGINEIEGYSENLTGQEWGDFKRFIVSCYPEFRSHFGSGVGLYLQRKDSDLAETVMLRFAAKGHPCLPVHDSFIVHHGLEDDLNSEMQLAFEAMFGAVGKVDSQIGIGELVKPTAEPIAPDIDALLNPVGFDGRLQAFRNARDTD